MGAGWNICKFYVNLYIITVFCSLIVYCKYAVDQVMSVNSCTSLLSCTGQLEQSGISYTVLCIHLWGIDIVFNKVTQYLVTAENQKNHMINY